MPLRIAHCHSQYTIHINLSFFFARIDSFISNFEHKILFKNLNEIKCFMDDNTIEGLIECGLTCEIKETVVTL